MIARWELMFSLALFDAKNPNTILPHAELIAIVPDNDAPVKLSVARSAHIRHRLAPAIPPSAHFFANVGFPLARKRR